MIDGCPTAITAPSFFLECFQSPEDYYYNKNSVDPIRLLRLGAFFMTTLIPGFYVALYTHHFTLIPPPFMYKIAQERAIVPFPTVVEVIIIMLFYELFRETARRLPQNIGQPLSITAGLILGNAATAAGLTSEATIVVTGVYAISSFINPKLQATTPIWSIMCVILSTLFGLHGFYVFLILIIAHLGSLNSCGYEYLYPFGTSTRYSFKNRDYITRGRLNGISKKIIDKD